MIIFGSLGDVILVKERDIYCYFTKGEKYPQNINKSFIDNQDLIIPIHMYICIYSTLHVPILKETCKDTLVTSI